MTAHYLLPPVLFRLYSTIMSTSSSSFLLVLVACLLAPPLVVQGFASSSRTSSRNVMTATTLYSSTAVPFFANDNNDEALFAPSPPEMLPPLELALLQQEQQQHLAWNPAQAWNNFVSNADVQIGRTILQRVFTQAAGGKNAVMTLDDLQHALASGAMTVLDAEHIEGIYDRADVQRKGYVTLDEWMTEATQTLRPSTA